MKQSKKLVITSLLTSLLLTSCKENAYISYLKNFAKNREGIVLNVAITKNNETTFKTYGNNGEEVALNKSIFFDIGSESKITLFYVVAKAIIEEKVSPNDHINKYLSIQENAYNPTIKELYTHCSAYGEYLPEHNFGVNEGVNNPFYKVKGDTLISDMNAFKAPRLYSNCYSDFGMTVLNQVMEKVYNKTFLELARPIWDDLGLTSIGINNTDDPDGSYIWESDDAYIPCMGISCTIEDLVRLANSLFRSDLDYVSLARDASNKYGTNKIGIGWRKYGSKYYQGGFVTHFANYVGVNLENNTSVVISSNRGNKSMYKMADLGDKCLEYALSL